MCGFGPASVSDERVLAAFERAITVDSAFLPAYPHLVDIAFRLYRDTTHALRYVDRYVALSSPGGGYHEALRFVASLLREPPPDSIALKTRLLSVRPNVRLLALRTLTRLPDRAETGTRVARAILSMGSAGGAEAATAGSRIQAAEALAWRGHLNEAYRALGDNDHTLVAMDVFALGVAPRGSPAAIIQRWSAEEMAGAPPYFFAVMPALAQRRDTTPIIALLELTSGIDRRLPSSMPPEMRANAAEWIRLTAVAGRAYLSLARGDSASALRSLETLPDSSCTMFCAEVPLLTAQLLSARGRYREADSLLTRRWVQGERPIELAHALERGRVAERLDKKDEAIEAYTLVIDAWANGDSLVQPFVRTAREGLRRLGVDERVRRPVRR